MTSLLTEQLFGEIAAMTSSVSRRGFLATGAAVLSAPVFGGSATKTHQVDVVVVGAGAAGIGAARRLSEAGLSYLLLEASPRIGGRAHTDTSTFGVPFDLGAHWLHRSETNPFVGYAEDYGFEVYAAANTEKIFVGGRPANSTEIARYGEAYNEAYSLISSAGRQGRDVAPSTVIASDNEWADLAHFAIGPWEMGKDFDQFSCKDWWSSGSGSDWFCREGYGALLARHAAGLQVRRDTPAELIRWGPQGVSVDTPRGSLKAAGVIVTVSTGVLAAETIRFEPRLPDSKRSAIAGVPMGLYNHIALQFRENVLGVGPDTYLLHKPKGMFEGSPEAVGVLANLSGTNLSIADVGGRFAGELERLGPDAALDFALSTLREIFGSDVDKHLLASRVTRWGQNPLTHGSYASAAPGRYHERAKLREPLGDRLWFAGEACSRDEWATVAGAYKNGREVAGQLADRLERAA